MKIIKPSIEFWGEVPTDYASAVKFIERAGRTCYKSEDKITEDSAEKFVRKLIAAGHLAMVEHSNFVVRSEAVSNKALSAAIIDAGKYLSVRRDKTYTYVGGNITAWCQRASYLNDPLDSEMFSSWVNNIGVKLFDFGEDTDPIVWEICPHNEIPKELRRYTVKFICDRGVSHELVRHRPCSFAQESTRYVNYGGKDMEFIEPAGFEDWSIGVKEEFKDHCKQCENVYALMLRRSLKPQQARAVLPNALKTEVVVTADSAEFRHIRALRTVPAAQPDMVRVMGFVPWEEIV